MPKESVTDRTIQQSIKRLKAWATQEHVVAVFANSARSFAVKIVAAAIGLCLSAYITRSLGAVVAGTFFLCTTIVAAAALIGRIGLDNGLVQLIGAQQGKGLFSNARGLVSRTLTLVLVTSTAIAVILSASSELLTQYIFDLPGFADLFRILVFSISPLALLMLMAAAFKGNGQPVFGVAVESAAQPSVCLLLMIVLIPVYGAYGAAASHVVACLSVAAIVLFLWYRFAPTSTDGYTGPTLRFIVSNSSPFAWAAISVLAIKETPTFLLGAIGNAADVALFYVANRTSFLISFTLLAVNAIVAPRFAADFSANRYRELEALSKTAAALLFAIALPTCLILVILSRSIMTLFGPDFASAQLTFVILVIGQFFNVATGCVQQLLMMSQYSRHVRNVYFGTLGLQLIIAIALIPSFGAEGAAVATSVAIICQNAVLVVIARHKLGFWPLPISSASGNR